MALSRLMSFDIDRYVDIFLERRVIFLGRRVFILGIPEEIIKLGSTSELGHFYLSSVLGEFPCPSYLQQFTI